MDSRKPAEQKKGAPLWMTTYADMVTLLLAFFVLLFAFSNIDVQKFQAIMSAFRGSMGVLDGGRTVTTDNTMQSHTAQLDLEQLQQIQQQLRASLQRENMEQTVLLHLEERGLVLRFADQVLFDLGRASLTPQAIDILSRVSPILLDLPNPIRVEGHTDNLPINTTQFPSNWELSTHRATNVIRYLIETEGFDPYQLSVAGYGEFRPIVPNDSQDNRALNRRVDIIIMYIEFWNQEPN